MNFVVEILVNLMDKIEIFKGRRLVRHHLAHVGQIRNRFLVGRPRSLSLAMFSCLEFVFLGVKQSKATSQFVTLVQDLGSKLRSDDMIGFDQKKLFQFSVENFVKSPVFFAG